MNSKTSSKKKTTYVNYCWNCYDTVNDALQERCPKCGWVICTCGACMGGRRFPQCPNCFKHEIRIVRKKES